MLSKCHNWMVSVVGKKNSDFLGFEFAVSLLRSITNSEDACWRSFIQIANSKGPRGEPWDTPQFIGKSPSSALFTCTYSDWSPQKRNKNLQGVSSDSSIFQFLQQDLVVYGIKSLEDIQKNRCNLKLVIKRIIYCSYQKLYSTLRWKPSPKSKLVL